MYSTWYLPPSKDSELPMRMRTFLSFKAKGGKGGRFWQIGLKPRCGVVTWTSHWFLMLCLSFLTSPSTIFPWGMGVSVESETRLPGPEFQPLCWLTQALHFSAQSSRSPRAVAQSLGRNPEAPRLSTEASGCSFYLQHTTHFPFKSCESHRKSVFVYWCWLFLTSCLSCYVSQAGSTLKPFCFYVPSAGSQLCTLGSVLLLFRVLTDSWRGSLFTHWRSIFIMY